MRPLRPALALWLVLVGCEQVPDYVAGNPALNESGAGGASGAGGMAGASGTGGMAGASGTGGVAGVAGGMNGSPDNCDPQVTRAYVLFSSIDADCEYATNDLELDNLLNELIYTKPAPELTPPQAESHPDPLCTIANLALPESLQPLRWRFAVDQAQVNRDIKVICPRYCVAMRLWLTEHRDRVRQCLPDASP
jgi:hypothetical protein